MIDDKVRVLPQRRMNHLFYRTCLVGEDCSDCLILSCVTFEPLRESASDRSSTSLDGENQLLLT